MTTQEGGEEHSVRFWNYPQPKEGPTVAYHNDAGSNPVLRGLPLAVAATLVSSSTFLQGILWRLNKFDRLKDLPGLEDYEPRHDPTVTPVRTSPAIDNVSVAELPAPAARLSGDNYYTCSDYHTIYVSGKLTPSEVAEALLSLIRRDVEPAGKHSIAFIDSKADIVRRAAEASTERYKQGKPLSCMDGVPVAVKDDPEIAGYKRSNGSKLDLTNSANETAWCVKLLEEAGAIVIGKTNMHEMGLDTTNNNPNYGTPLNPHNPAYYTGGSSGGSAYAVAAGLCPIAIGVDGGGSIRLPASFCGVYGLKPTHGRISAGPAPEVGSVGVNGPIASSIDDLAVAYRIMAQSDPTDRRSAMFPSPLTTINVQSQPEGRTKFLGICRDWVDRSDPVILKMFEDTVGIYSRKHNYEIVNIDIPLLPQGQKAHALTILSEIRSTVTHAQISRLSYPSQLLLTIAGSHATCQDFLAAQRLRDMLMRHLAHLWEKFPGMLIVTPTTPCTGWKIGNPRDVAKGGWGVSDGDMSLKNMEFVYVANWTGCPAISCPMGYAEGDIPIGLMGMAEWGSEEQLLAWAKEGEEIVGDGGARRPQRQDGWVDVLELSRKN